MIALLYLTFFLTYAGISVLVVRSAYRRARLRGKNPWPRAGLAALLCYLVVFWDHIPTLVLHKRYCDRDAGFHVYKTLEQWKSENPGVAETLKYEKAKDTYRGEVRVTRLNQRFSKESIDGARAMLSIGRANYRVIDSSTREVLAEYTNYSRGTSSFALGASSFASYKPWLSKKNCEINRDYANRKKFYQFNSHASLLGEVK